MLIVLLKTTIIWLLLLLAYFMLLSREKAPHWNRAFLWLAFISGIAIPFIENPFWSVQPAIQTVTQAITPVNNLTAGSPLFTTSFATTETNTWDWTRLLTYLWLAGAVFQAFLLLRNTGQLYFLKKFSRKNLHPVANFYSNENTPAAFSFGKLIYLPEVAYAEQDLRLILQHEQQHARHKHWIDNILLELLQITFWFHPLFYVFKKQIKLVHEYQVDQEIDATDQYDYAKLLLAQNNKAYTDKLIHTFNFSPLKNRIAMMTNTKKVNTWKYFMALPAIVLSFGLMSAGTEAGQSTGKDNTSSFTGNNLESKNGARSVEEIPNSATGAANKKVTNAPDTAIFRSVMNKAIPPSNWQKYLNESLKFPEKFKGDSISVRIIMEFIIEKDGSTSSPRALRSEGYINNNQATTEQLAPFTEEAIRVISMAPKWQPAIQNESTVRSYFTLPLTFQMN